MDTQSNTNPFFSFPHKFHSNTIRSMSVIIPTTAEDSRVKPKELILSYKVEKWANADYHENMDMFMADPDAIAFVCVHNNFVTMVEGVSVTRDPNSKRTKIFLGVSGNPINFSVFAAPAE